MFERFSSGYYLGRMYIEPHDGVRPVVTQELYGAIREQLYESDTDLPVVMKLDRLHFPVTADAEMPPETLAVPSTYDVHAPGHEAPREVLLAEPGQVRILLASSGWTRDGDEWTAPDAADSTSTGGAGAPTTLPSPPGPRGPPGPNWRSS